MKLKREEYFLAIRLKVLLQLSPTFKIASTKQNMEIVNKKRKRDDSECTSPPRKKIMKVNTNRYHKRVDEVDSCLRKAQLRETAYDPWKYLINKQSRRLAIMNITSKRKLGSFRVQKSHRSKLLRNQFPHSYTIKLKLLSELDNEEDKTPKKNVKKSTSLWRRVVSRQHLISCAMLMQKHRESLQEITKSKEKEQ